jgi:hypothetical protein
MDDSIRPSLAAKRRSAHREIQIISDDDTIESFSVHADSESEDHDSSDSQGATEKKETKKKSKSNDKGKKGHSESLEPTRRSSRRTTVSKVAYNMNVHPQDNDLEVSSSDNDDDDVTAFTARRRNKITHLFAKSYAPHQDSSNVCSPEDRIGTHDVIDIGSNDTEEDGAPMCSSREGSVPDKEIIFAHKQGMQCINILRLFYYPRCKRNGTITC